MSQEDGHLPRVEASFPPLRHPCVHIQSVFMENSFFFQPRNSRVGQLWPSASPPNWKERHPRCPEDTPFQCAGLQSPPLTNSSPLILLQAWSTPSYLPTPPLASLGLLHTPSQHPVYSLFTIWHVFLEAGPTSRTSMTYCLPRSLYAVSLPAPGICSP